MTRGLWTALGVRCVGEGAENSAPTDQWLTIGRSWKRANAESCACTLQGSELPRRTLHLRVRDGPDRRAGIAMPEGAVPPISTRSKGSSK